MADERITVRKASGAGAVFKTRKEADAFLKANPDYNEEAATKAIKSDEVEDKAVKPAANKKQDGK